MLSLQSFLNTYDPGTRAVYRQAICSFLETIYCLPYKGSGRSLEHMALMEDKSIEYLNAEQDHFTDLLSFLSAISHLAPKTRRGHLSTVMYWLELNRKVLDRANKIFLTKRAGAFKPATDDYAVSKEEIRRWYEHLSRMGRVLLLIQMSSGMRIGEVLALLPEDIDIDSSPAEVRVSKTKLHTGEIQQHTKNKTSRYTFISSEAVMALREWMLIRDDWLRTSSRKTFKENDNDDRIFPTAHTTVQEMYNRGLKKAGLFQVDKRTGQATISSRTLRRYFVSQLKTAMTPDMVELLTGHEGYLSGSYRRYPKDQVRKEYQNAEYAVMLSSNIDVQEIQDIRSTNVSLTQELERLHRAIPGIVQGEISLFMAAKTRVDRYTPYDDIQRRELSDEKPRK